MRRIVEAFLLSVGEHDQAHLSRTSILEVQTENLLLLRIWSDEESVCDAEDMFGAQCGLLGPELVYHALDEEPQHRCSSGSSS